MLRTPLGSEVDPWLGAQGSVSSSSSDWCDHPGAVRFLPGPNDLFDWYASVVGEGNRMHLAGWQNAGLLKHDGGGISARTSSTANRCGPAAAARLAGDRNFWLSHQSCNNGLLLRRSQPTSPPPLSSGASALNGATWCQWLLHAELPHRPGEVGQALDGHFRYGAGLLKQPKMRHHGGEYGRVRFSLKG